MFNTFNGISMQIAEEERREIYARRRWRVLILMLLIIAFCYSCFSVYQRLASRYLALRHDDYMALAGPIAEEAEININDAVLGNGEMQQQLLPALYNTYTDLAVVRIWSPTGQLKCETTRTGKKTVHFSTTPTLPDMGAREALLRQAKITSKKNWSDPIAQLQLIEGEQRDISDDLDILFDDDDDLQQERAEIYRRQERLLAMTQSLNIESNTLQNTADKMNEILDALPRGREALPEAIIASAAVLGDLTAALTDYRALISRVAVLPRSVSRYSYYRNDWLHRLLPVAQGERIMLPLFAPAISSSLLAQVGTLETIHYYHPAAALRLARWQDAIWPAAVLIFILIMAFWPRPQVEKAEEK